MAMLSIAGNKDINSQVGPKKKKAKKNKKKN
eukprot:CAMPEP_0168335116 /NCGR_PEP_ID=MMETSP0213-20121227/10705_1 /TAXON_ID=151035 /ORGANISM="Euplotes harpa, Strain FSP1.4" /LENGTH=30 /DNA_ID= /DNA_START= /DNA_END= /DNA_ORIENTATION=